MIDKPYNITDDETLYRLVSHPGCFDENNELSPDAFSLYHKNEDYVSMIRAFYCEKKDAINLGYRIKKWPNKKDKFYGILSLNAGKIKIIEHILLKSYYTDDFKGHAGISYLLEDGSKLKHTGYEVMPSWLLTVQTLLCAIVDDIEICQS